MPTLRMDDGAITELSLKVESQRVFDELRKESDRGFILAGGAIADDLLEDLLRLNLVDDEQALDALLGRGRPLESFGARVTLTRCLGLLDPIDLHNLEVLRKIRNHAAHHAAAVTFEDQKVASSARNFRHYHPVPDELDARGRCHGAVFQTLGILWAFIELCSTLQRPAGPYAFTKRPIVNPTAAVYERTTRSDEPGEG